MKFDITCDKKLFECIALNLLTCGRVKFEVALNLCFSSESKSYRESYKWPLLLESKEETYYLQYKAFTLHELSMFRRSLMIANLYYIIISSKQGQSVYGYRNCYSNKNNNINLHFLKMFRSAGSAD